MVNDREPIAGNRSGMTTHAWRMVTLRARHGYVVMPHRFPGIGSQSFTLRNFSSRIPR
jgi:hypothetical protein